MENTEAKIINLPKIEDPRGNLSIIEENKHIPFEIKRTYWIYDVPGGEMRGGHAFKEQQEFIVALSGSFDVIVDDGENIKTFSLNRSYYGLLVPAGQWRSMENFSTNSLALVLASTYYNEDDYIRNFDYFTNHYNKSLAQIEDNIENSKSVLNYNYRNTSVDDCKVFDLEKNHRIKGNITVIENQKQVPFDIKRVYYLYDVPGGEERGGHAHKELYQLIMAASGSFDVELDDGHNKKIITLNRPYQGLFVVPGIWRELVNFSSGSSCLVLASEKYDENDYIREYIDFENIK